MLEMHGSVTRQYPPGGRVAFPAANLLATCHVNNPSPSIQGLRSCIVRGPYAEWLGDAQPFPVGGR